MIETLYADPGTLAYIAISIGMSIIAAKLAQQKNKTPVQDSKPTTLTERGEFSNYVIGRRRVGPIVAVANQRRKKNEKIEGGGKGLGGSKKQKVYVEFGWHVLCPGPMTKLWSIIQGGEKIFIGPIDPISHPSGSEISLGKEGTFRIYWGDGVQPIDSVLATNLSINSAFPFVAGILWDKKRLGTSPIWEFLEYDIETRPVFTGLTHSSPWMNATQVLSGITYPITAVVNSFLGLSSFTLDGNQTTIFKAGGQFVVAGHTPSNINGTYDIFSTIFTSTATLFDPDAIGFTEIIVGQTLSGATVTGTLEPYVNSEDDGVNAAHAIYQMLFAPFPLGLNRNPARYDLDSLEVMGEVFESERIPCSITGTSGDTMMQLLSQLMQDMGFLMPLVNGKVRFQLVRNESVVPALPDDLVIGPKPERIVKLNGLKADRLAFTFSDRTRNYRDSVIPYDHDYQGFRNASQKPRNIGMPTIIGFDAGVQVANRRGLEESTPGDSFKFHTNRGARTLYPGQVFSQASTLPGVLRVAGVKEDQLTTKVVITCIKDVMGTIASTYTNEPGGGQSDNQESLVDLGNRIVEVPARLSGLSLGSQVSIITPRIRANDSIGSANIWISADNVTYTEIGSEPNTHVGGPLLEAIPVTGRRVLETGFTFTIQGPDLANALDLTGDDANFRAGRQLLVVNDEIMLCRKITNLGGGIGRADGLFRARYATPKSAHSIGDRIYVIENPDGVTAQQDILITPGATIYVKVQPEAGSFVPLDEVSFLSTVLEGKGIAGQRISNLLNVDYRGPYFDGSANINLTWKWRDQFSTRGAGEQVAGSPVDTSPVSGVFLLDFKNAGGVSQLMVTTLGTTYTLTSGDFATYFGAATVFKLEIRHLVNGVTGPGVEVEFTDPF